MAEQPAGWYPDPTGKAAQRYWDGAAWTDHVDGAAPSPFPPPPPRGAASPPPLGSYVQPAHTYPRPSQAGWALAMSIGSFVCCGVLAIPGIIMGRNELQAIDRGETDPSQRGLANAAYIVGIVGAVFLAIGLVIIAVVLSAGNLG